MKRCFAVLCALIVFLPITRAFAADGAASTQELRERYKSYFGQKDEQKLATLAYWKGVTQDDREGFYRSLRHDLQFRLESVEFEPLSVGGPFEYTREGVTYAPNLKPVGRLVARYRTQGNVSNLSTSYLVGKKDGRYYIALAAPKPR